MTQQPRHYLRLTPSSIPFGKRGSETSRRLTALRGVRFVNNHGKGFALEFANLLSNHAEFLDRRDNDVFPRFKKTSELRRMLGQRHAPHRQPVLPV